MWNSLKLSFVLSSYIWRCTFVALPNIDMDDNSLDVELAKSIGAYFQLTNQEMNDILDEVSRVVKSWRIIANKIRIARSEQDRMEAAFNY